MKQFVVHLSNLKEKTFLLDYLRNKAFIHMGNLNGDYACVTRLDNGQGVYTLAKNPDLENVRMLTVLQLMDYLEGRGQELIIDLDFGFIEYDGKRLDSYDLVNNLKKIILNYDGKPVPINKISKIVIRDKENVITHFTNVEA